jgi:hypothetical protein
MSVTVSPTFPNTLTSISSKGQILTHNGTSVVALSPGSNGQVLSSVSSAASGLGYAAYSATASVGYYEKIVSTTLTTATSEILFTGLSTSASQYGFIKVTGVSRNSDSSYSYSLDVTLNSTTSGSFQVFYTNDVHGQPFWKNARGSLEANGYNGYNFYPTGTAPSNNADTDEYGLFEVIIGRSPSYNTINWKAIGFQTGIGTDIYYERGYAASYSVALNSIRIKHNTGGVTLNAGSVFTVYGYKAS